MAMESRVTTSQPPINSNILNYLVWRYLQEVGFAMAATWLGKEWHRCPDDVMPFAKYVRPSQLVHMVQDGLLVDQVRRESGKAGHYFFGDDFGPDYATPVYDISGERKPGDVPDGPSDLLATNGGLEEAGALILRRRLPVQPHTINADAMDLDDGSHGHAEHMSDIEPPSGAIREMSTLVDTLKIGQSKMVGTEKPLDLLPTSSFLPWPSKSCTSTPIWSPFSKEALLIGGSNMLRLYGIRSDPSEHMSVDIPLSANQFEVGLMCWTSPSTAVVSLFESLEGGDVEDVVGKLVYITSYGQGPPQTLSCMTGVVRALRFRASTGLLLSLSTGTSTTISIHHVTEAGVSQVCITNMRDYALSDAFWMNDARFIACGQGVLRIFDMGDREIRIIQTQEFKRPWFQLKYDPHCDAAVFGNEESTVLRHYNVKTEDTKTQSFEPSGITAFEFQPIPESQPYKPGSQRMLATCTRHGLIQLWDIANGFVCIRKLPLYGFPGQTLRQISFSPNGTWLAAAGFDLAAMWTVNATGQLKAVWKPTSDQWRSVPDEAAGEEDWVHELRWDMAGEKVVFTLEDQAVVIRAPQHSGDQDDPTKYG